MVGKSPENNLPEMPFSGGKSESKKDHPLAKLIGILSISLFCVLVTGGLNENLGNLCGGFLLLAAIGGCLVATGLMGRAQDENKPRIKIRLKDQ